MEPTIYNHTASDVIVGADPGQTGAFAVVTTDGVLIDLAPMPADDTGVMPAVVGTILADWNDRLNIVAACVEKVHAMPKQGTASTFKFGTSYGIILGALGTLNIPTTLVTAPAWKKAMGLSKDKDQSRRMASDLWPWWAARFARKKDDGLAEAALIAEHARRVRG